MRQFFNVAQQAEQMPSRVESGPAAQSESIRSFVIAQIAKHRLDRCHALPVQISSDSAVYDLPQALGEIYR